MGLCTRSPSAVLCHVTTLIVLLSAVACTGTEEALVGPTEQDQVAPSDMRGCSGKCASLTVSPSSLVLTVGVSEQLSATLSDTYRKRSGSLLWSSSDSLLAKVSPAGKVTALAPGAVVVTASAQGIKGNASITIRSIPGDSLPGDSLPGDSLPGDTLPGGSPPAPTPPDSALPMVTGVTLDPAAANVQTGATQQFSAKVTWSDSLTHPFTLVWSATGGSISSVGSYVAGTTPGTYRVIAATGGKADTASVTITAPPPTITSLSLAPATTSIQTGATQQFTAKVTWSDSLTHPFTLTWSATGGTISNTGSYAAGSTAGTYRVIAATGVKADTATVTITAPAPTPVPSAPLVSELPRVYLDTRYPALAGRTINVSAGGNLQAAINTALPGDEIVLQAGATFSGNFTLPGKTGTGWIVIKSGGTLPPVGTRITPASAAQLAKIITPNTNYAIAATGNVGFYRLVGLEISGPPGGSTNQIVMLGLGNQTAAQTPHDLTFDRVWIHGGASVEMGTCVELNSASTAIIDSYIDNCHSNILTDGGYGIRGGNGPGPYKIVNNYIAGSGLNIFFGGVDPSVAGLVPSDIEIRRNYLFKPASWKGVWKVKNILESKNSQRVLVEGNVLDGSWRDGQDGVAINLKSSNQNGACTWCVTQDWTLRYNKIRNAGYGAVVSANPTPNMPAVLAKRITFAHNVFDRLNQGVYTGYTNNTGLFLYFGGAVQDLVADHNTVITSSGVGAVKWAHLGPFSRFRFTNNVVVRGAGGVFGCAADPSGCGGEGSVALNTYAPGGTFAGNAIIGALAGSYPAGNFFPTSLTATGFANPGGYDWTLTSASPLKSKGTDGTDPGADIPAVEATTQGVAPN